MGKGGGAVGGGGMGGGETGSCRNKETPGLTGRVLLPLARLVLHVDVQDASMVVRREDLLVVQWCARVFCSPKQFTKDQD